MPILSIIILSYNTRDITRDCLMHLVNSFKKYPSFSAEIIVVDNASTDGSPEMIQEFKKQLKSDHIQMDSICNRENEGFTRGNNQGVHNAAGRYILFLNSDVMIRGVDWPDIIDYLDAHADVAALTVRVELPSGEIDPAAHRGFPTVWNSFCYYSKLEMVTKQIPGLNTLFGGYHLTDRDLDSVHEIDSPSGAFFLARKSVLDELQGFDETFFMYGEDIDLAFRIKEKDFQIIYYPHSVVEHIKYQSGLKNKEAQARTKKYFYDAMRIFYRKHYEKKYPWLINQLVYFFINLKSQL